MTDIPTAAAGPDAVTDPAIDAELAAEAALIERHAHPTDGTYMVVGLVLAVLTAIEVGLYYIKGGALTTVTLLLFMALKFAIVAGFFMHLRFDSPLLRRVFIMGIAFAVVLYTLVLLMFGVLHF